MAHWKNKTVVVTGGSDGLGREIALNFARHEAQVLILARNETRLRQVADEARSDGLPIDWVVGDVTDDQSVKDSINEIIRRRGAIDVWVNNVGKSSRVALTECGVEEYQKQMEINFYSSVRCALAVLPHLAETNGQLVNIGSLACKTGWPFVAPYSASKHALAAFNHQLRLEGPTNINYLLVCSGPIQRPDAGQRYESQAAGLPESAGRPGGGVKLRGIPPDKLAEKIERSCRRRKKELVVPGYARIAFALAQLSPRMGDLFLNRSREKE
jgi:short-subunit dehydrogenase